MRLVKNEHGRRKITEVDIVMPKERLSKMSEKTPNLLNSHDISYRSLPEPDIIRRNEPPADTNGNQRNIIRRSGSGSHVAPIAVMQPAIKWPPVKQYGQGRTPPVTRAQPAPENDDELITKLRQDVARLSQEIDTLGKVILRLRTEIKFQIRFWQHGMKYGEWESPEAMKRRVSALRGALEYLWHEVSLSLQAKDEENRV